MTAPVAEFYPTQSTRHHSARAYRDLVDWLASLRLKGRADRTLDDYERTIAALIDPSHCTKSCRTGDWRLCLACRHFPVRIGAERTRTAATHLTPDSKGSGR